MGLGMASLVTAIQDHHADIAWYIQLSPGLGSVPVCGDVAIRKEKTKREETRKSGTVDTWC